MQNIDLFTWWAISISLSSVFLTLVAIYLYTGSRSKRKQDTEGGAGWFRLGGNFVFIYVLLGLLVFYIFSVQLGAGSLSEEVFAVGNIVVEALLVFYLIRNGRRGSEKA